MSRIVRTGMLGLIALGATLGSPALPAQTPTAPVPLPGVYDGGYLIFRSADQRFAYWLDGRLMVDGATYWGGENTLGGGTTIRRARLGVKSQLYTDWYAEIDFDFSENAVEIKDAWAGYTGFANTILKAGQFKEPFSLETVTSSKNVMFMERSYIDNFSPTRTIGAGAVRWGRHWQVSAGVFGQEAGQVDETARNEGWAATGRVTIAPVIRDRQVVHFGVSLSRRTPDAAEGSDTNSFRFRARPETDVSKARFVSTGRVRFVDHASYYNAEAAVMMGSLHLQGEYTQVALRRLEDRATAKFAGGYVAATYFLTGDSRKYLVEAGEFDRVLPTRSGGAWEIGARYSTIDLNDDDPDVDIMGGKATNYTLGLTWHINANLKWLVNFVRVENDENAEPDLGENPVAGDKFNILQTRVALAF